MVWYGPTPLQSGLSRVGYTVVTRDKAQTMRLVNRDVRPLANEKRQDGTARAKPKVGLRQGSKGTWCGAAGVCEGTGLSSVLAVVKLIGVLCLCVPLAWVGVDRQPRGGAAGGAA